MGGFALCTMSFVFSRDSVKSCQSHKAKGLSVSVLVSQSNLSQQTAATICSARCRIGLSQACSYFACVCVSVSFHRVGHNEIIGVMRVGCSAEGLGRDHWNEMLAYPRKPIAHWHPLVESKKSEKEVVVQLKTFSLNSLTDLDTHTHSLCTSFCTNTFISTQHL